MEKKDQILKLLAEELGYKDVKKLKEKLKEEKEKKSEKTSSSGSLISRLESGQGISEAIAGRTKEKITGVKKAFSKEGIKSFGKDVYRSIFSGDDIVSAYMRGRIVKKKGSDSKVAADSDLPGADSLEPPSPSDEENKKPEAVEKEGKSSAAFLKIIAKESMSLPGMARDTNVLRQNLQKLVKLWGGEKATGADAHLLKSSERAEKLEVESEKEKLKVEGKKEKSTSPTKKGEEKNDFTGFKWKSDDSYYSKGAKTVYDDWTEEERLAWFDKFSKGEISEEEHAKAFAPISNPFAKDEEFFAEQDRIEAEKEKKETEPTVVVQKTGESTIDVDEEERAKDEEFFAEQDRIEAEKEKKETEPTVVMQQADESTKPEKEGGGGLLDSILGFFKNGLMQGIMSIFNPMAMLKLLGKVFVIATIVISLFKGITAAFDKWKETGSLKEAIIAGLGAIVDFLSFGFFGEDTVRKLFDSVSDFMDPIIKTVSGVVDDVKNWIGDNVGIPEFSLPLGVVFPPGWLINKGAEVIGKKAPFPDPIKIGPWYPFKTSKAASPAGAAGSDGKQGKSGTAGAPSATGEKGKAGMDGKPGTAGTLGAAGAPGSPGAAGSVGTKGKNGSIGTLLVSSLLAAGMPASGMAGINNTIKTTENSSVIANQETPGVPGTPGTPGVPGTPGSLEANTSKLYTSEFLENPENKKYIDQAKTEFANKIYSPQKIEKRAKELKEKEIQQQKSKSPTPAPVPTVTESESKSPEKVKLPKGWSIDPTTGYYVFPMAYEHLGSIRLNPETTTQKDIDKINNEFLLKEKEKYEKLDAIGKENAKAWGPKLTPEASPSTASGVSASGSSAGGGSTSSSGSSPSTSPSPAPGGSSSSSSSISGGSLSGSTSSSGGSPSTSPSPAPGGSSSSSSSISSSSSSSTTQSSSTSTSTQSGSSPSPVSSAPASSVSGSSAGSSQSSVTSSSVGSSPAPSVEPPSSAIPPPKTPGSVISSASSEVAEQQRMESAADAGSVVNNKTTNNSRQKPEKARQKTASVYDSDFVNIYAST